MIKVGDTWVREWRGFLYKMKVEGIEHNNFRVVRSDIDDNDEYIGCLLINKEGFPTSEVNMLNERTLFLYRHPCTLTKFVSFKCYHDGKCKCFLKEKSNV